MDCKMGSRIYAVIVILWPILSLAAGMNELNIALLSVFDADYMVSVYFFLLTMNVRAML